MASNLRHLAGKRTVPVLSVAKEVAALQRWPRSRFGRAEDRSTTNCGETFCLAICLSFVWMFFFPSRSNNRLGLHIECSKLTCFAREKATRFLGGEIDDRRPLLSVVLAGRRASWKRGKQVEDDVSKLKTRRKKTIIDTRIRVQTSTSSTVEFEAPPAECTMHAPAHAVV